MQDVNLSTRYLNAYISDKDNVEQLKRLNDIKTILQGLKNNKVVLQQLTSSSISNNDKEALINKLVPNNFTRCQSLFKLLIKKNRVDLIEKFDPIINQMIEERLEEKTATITSEFEYNETEKKQIENIIEKKLNVKIKALYLTKNVLIGGFKAIVGNKMIDCSIKNILMQFKENALSKT